MLTIETDLTSSQRQFTTFMQEAKIKKWNCEVTFEKLFSQLEQLVLETELKEQVLPASLKGAEDSDYVVSSLVGSVLFIRLKETIFEAWSECFKIDLPTFLKNDNAKYSKFLNIINKCQSLFILKHAEMLDQCANPLGSIYYADTTTVCKMAIIPTELLNKIASILKAGRSEGTVKNWTWQPYENTFYDIWAFLTQNKMG